MVCTLLTVTGDEDAIQLRDTRSGVTEFEAVANRPTRPAWNTDSFFSRFVRK